MAELERRIALYAARMAGVYFVDVETIIDPARPELFASDKSHPSPQGSALIGKLVARTLSDPTRN